MNIAAAMNALKVEDLDRTAKHALLVLACHADESTASATVSVRRLATDLGLSYGATWKALHRAARAGYLNADPVDKHPSKARTWHLRSRADARPRSRAGEKKVARGRATHTASLSFKDLKEGGRDVARR
jgi:hypothetical protein